jgi:hypothetical protein
MTDSLRVGAEREHFLHAAETDAQSYVASIRATLVAPERLERNGPGWEGAGSKSKIRRSREGLSQAARMDTPIRPGGTRERCHRSEPRHNDLLDDSKPCLGGSRSSAHRGADVLQRDVAARRESRSAKSVEGTVDGVWPCQHRHGRSAPVLVIRVPASRWKHRLGDSDREGRNRLLFLLTGHLHVRDGGQTRTGAGYASVTSSATGCAGALCSIVSALRSSVSVCCGVGVNGCVVTLRGFGLEARAGRAARPRGLGPDLGIPVARAAALVRSFDACLAVAFPRFFSAFFSFRLALTRRLTALRTARFALRSSDFPALACCNKRIAAPSFLLASATVACAFFSAAVAFTNASAACPNTRSDRPFCFRCERLSAIGVHLSLEVATWSVTNTVRDSRSIAESEEHRCPAPRPYRPRARRSQRRAYGDGATTAPVRGR